MKKIAKILLALGVAACLIKASGDVKHLYNQKVPPYSEGQCLLVPGFDGSGAVVKIVLNNYKESITTVEVEWLPGIFVYTDITFEELREADVKAVNCEENN